ncbi:translation factor GTPase family protein [uncultured Eubacterium sp.]|uniref:translation factor GTPase family protein n=1 Tax=uncultured Eubacterium sp. TaxID=165185 RepID=UPI002598D7FE|nr:TetM/TetW/TetO/TetS family tetracycline resistance ribosomal protection protein [uncultured Eubacterium sp.]
MKKITLGILAHVDSGKTTLSEAFLYATGKIRKLGRVDHKDAFLDNFDLEKQRGITIFSKQAELEYEDTKITLLDTPGHVDFSAEMERTLQVLDYAVLVVSGSEGVQGHTETLWKLLNKYNIPTFIFVNKMDMPGTNKEFALTNIKNKFGDGVIDFSVEEKDMEAIAVCDEDVLEMYMESGEISDETIADLVYERKLFPCYFGSALKNEGIDKLLDGISSYSFEPVYHEEFGAKVFKIVKENGVRLTYMKITGGSIKVKDIFSGITDGNQWSEKINDIRIYSGEKFKSINQADAGCVCAISGLNNTYPGQGLGFEMQSESPNLQPVLSYQIIIPDNINVNQAYKMLKELEEEDPTLSLKWNEETKEIIANVMGPIQIQVLKHVIKERFDMDVEFGTGSILYKETINNTVEGVGHFEPLKHYAEVHLLMEPGQLGSGITFESNLNESLLSRNWQRLIMTHLAEKDHKGVLTGSPITDIHFTLVAGKAHIKHTEGGDFREATYRAIRQGLKKAESVLLEPYYNFTLKVPTENIGRAMTDIDQMSGNINQPETEGEMSVITGFAPAATIGDYINTVNEYTHGTGTLSLDYKGYGPCHNSEEIIAEKAYDSEADIANPTGSVFCSHGAGFVVPWDQVEQYMHVKTDSKNGEMYDIENVPVMRSASNTYRDSYATDKELEEIFEKTFGPIKRKKYTEKKVRHYSENKQKVIHKKVLPQCVLVDGYNIVFAWDELKEIAKTNVDGARDKLLDIMCNYQGYKGNTVIVVFDAYNVKKHAETVSKYHNIYVVYTKEAETADMYIAKTTHKLANKFQVTVATSDALEQLIIMGHGALRMSASNFKEEVDNVNIAISEQINKTSRLENYVLK